jgi:hypothetical protein
MCKNGKIIFGRVANPTAFEFTTKTPALLQRRKRISILPKDALCYLLRFYNAGDVTRDRGAGSRNNFSPIIRNNIIGF